MNDRPGHTLCVVIAGSAVGTAWFASKLIGEREVMREPIAKSRSGGSLFATDHRSVSTSQQHVTESTVLPSEIEQFSNL